MKQLNRGPHCSSIVPTLFFFFFFFHFSSQSSVLLRKNIRDSSSLSYTSFVLEGHPPSYEKKRRKNNTSLKSDQLPLKSSTFFVYSSNVCFFQDVLCFPLFQHLIHTIGVLSLYLTNY